MDPPNGTRMMMAPGAGAARVSTPAHPGLDETLVEPEGRAEVIRGRRVEVAPALPEHGDPHFRLDVALGTHLAPGYTGSTDMLTRTSEESNFATDTSVRREGIDPATGQRYLEELAFEVVNTQRPGDVTEKAEELTARGVRRVFAVFARRGVVSEWRGGQWVAIPADGAIEDRCLVAPLPVAALLRAGSLNAAAVRGLLARGEPELQRLLQAERLRGEQRGKAEGKAEALRAVLLARGFVLAAVDDARIAACHDADTLDRWIARAVVAATLDAVWD